MQSSKTNSILYTWIIKAPKKEKKLKFYNRHESEILNLSNFAIQ